MRINRRLVTVAVFVIILITLIVVFVRTFAGKRYPDTISEADLVAVEELSDLDEFTEDGTSKAEDIASEGVSVVSQGTFLLLMV